MAAIFLRELKACFVTPTGYIFAGVCWALSGAIFYIISLSAGSADISGVFAAMYFVLTVMTPFLTARLFSEEKTNGTNKLLYSLPISAGEIALGKFFSAYAVFLTGVLPMFTYGVTLSFFTDVDAPLLAGSCLGTALLGGVYVSLDMCISASTESRTGATVAGIFANAALFSANPLYVVMPWQEVGEALKFVSVYDRFTEFTVGIIRPQNIIFFVTATAMLIFLTARRVSNK